MFIGLVGPVAPMRWVMRSVLSRRRTRTNSARWSDSSAAESCERKRKVSITARPLRRVKSDAAEKSAGPSQRRSSHDCPGILQKEVARRRIAVTGGPAVPLRGGNLDLGGDLIAGIADSFG